MTDEVSGIFTSDGTQSAAIAAYKAGRQAASRQRYVKAVKCYTDALAYAGTPALFRARVHEYRGLCHWLLSDFDAAEADYSAALNLSDDPEQIGF